MWVDYRAPGPDGLYLVIICMAWWLRLVTIDDRADFDALAEDMAWVLQQVDEDKPAPASVAPQKRKGDLVEQSVKKAARRSSRR